MSSLNLHKLQAQFKQSLLYQDSSINEHIQEQNGFDAEQLLQIYRNNFIISVTESLQCTYPNTLQLVGEEFFNAVARAFILAKPPAINNICVYGQQFYQYLSEFEQLQEIPFVAEMARFEQQLEETKRLALSDIQLDVEQLQRVPEHQHHQLQFTLTPNISCFTSKQDISQLLSIIKSGQEESVDLNTPCFLLLIKQANFEVTVKTISEAQWQLINQLKKHYCLSELTPTTLHNELAELLSLQIINGFTIK